MSENRSRFVLLCQQSLVVAAVAAIAAPALNVVTLEIVAPARPDGPGAVHSTPANDVPHASAGAGDAPSLVPSRPVRPVVTAVPLSGVSGAGLRALGASTAAVPTGSGAAARLVAADGDPETDDLTVLSAPQSVDSLATVGVTWQHGENLADDDITISVRTEKDGTWSPWMIMPYHDEHGPDVSSSEGERSRPGTDPVYVGHVDDVQVKAVTATGEAPDGMQLAMVDPGAEDAPAVEDPAIDTGTLELSSADTTTDTTGTDEPTDGTDGTDGGTGDTDATPPTETPDEASLSAGVVTAKPKIYSRAQWGADERMRDKSSLHYGEVHAGFVHHTVNANNYTAAQVPAIIRGIYAYHTQSKGWSDVGYNFLVDRFGRIWEGRYGGVDRPVVGAHTLGYNDDAFAMSAIGNFETAQPPAAMLDAYGRLFAWKLNLHGVNVSSTKQWVTKKYLKAINGHRDVGQTACPGKYLYAKIPTIRTLAAKYQKSFASRDRTANIAGSTRPDLVVRDKVTKRAYLLRTGSGQLGFSSGTSIGTGWNSRDLVTPVGDVTGDGVSDLLARTTTTKRTSVYAGDGKGHFGAATATTAQFAKADQLTGVGDWNGDGKADVVTRSGATKKLYLSLGDGRGRFGAARLLSATWGAYRTTVGAGDFTGDKRADLAVLGADGRLSVVAGTGSGLGTTRLVSTGWKNFDLLTGLNDVTGDGRTDLVGRSRTSGLTYVYSGNGAGKYGTRLGPFAQLNGLGVLMGVGQVTGSAVADLVGRDSAGRLKVFAAEGGQPIEAVTSTGQTMPTANQLLNAGDWDGDGDGDVITRSASTGALYLYRGNGNGALSAAVKMVDGFGSVKLLSAVGDITGDGYPDLMGQPSGGSMRIYPGDGRSAFKTSYVAHSAISAAQQVPAGLWNADGSPDTLLRRTDGKLVLYPGNGPGGLTGGTVVGTVSSGYDWLVGVGDVNRDGRPDLAARETSTQKLWLLPGTATGLGTRSLLGAGMSRFDLAG
jgi:N-acetylmuramoyl-L-alanine amidase/FG-GAP-like repeat